MNVLHPTGSSANEAQAYDAYTEAPDEAESLVPLAFLPPRPDFDVQAEQEKYRTQEHQGTGRGSRHRFRGKKDLLLAVFRKTEEEFVLRLAQATVVSVGDPWQQLRAGCQAVLDACLDPEMQRIVLLDVPAVLGWQTWHEVESEYALGFLAAGLQMAMEEGVIEQQPTTPLAHLLFGALGEAAQMIVRADDVEATRRIVGRSFDRLLEKLRVAQD